MKRLCAVLLLFTFATPLLHGQTVLKDNFEGGLGAWQAEGSWGLTTARSVSPAHAATDSPGAFYTNNTSRALALAASVSLAPLTRPVLAFQHAYFLEEAYDFGRVEISTNGGAAWLATALGEYTGTQADWTREQLDLSPYAGAANVRVRFRLVTDSSVVMDGWYVDDVIIGEAPAPVTLAVTQTNRNSVLFSWTPSAVTNFAAYRLYRSLTSGVAWRTARLISEVTTNTITTGTDLTTSPKTKYYYRLAVVNADGLLALGNEIAVTTPAGMDYPFVDNGEGGAATWIADAPWALSAEDAVSPTQAWSDSPGTNYSNGIGSQSLTLAAPMTLAGKATAPVLSFQHKFDFGPGDSGNVEISLNNGADWTSLASFAGGSSGGWKRGRLALNPYTNASSALIRFRLTTDPSGTADGWHVDDISVADSPTTVNAPVLDLVTSHSIRVSWAANSDLTFSHYAVFRSTASGVGINSTLAAVIPSQGTTTFTDTGLALDTVYYYRVFAVNQYGTHSADSVTESSVRTLNNPAPFTDGFEGSLVSWNFTGSWGRATNEAHSGSACLSDSPGSNYMNSVDSYALTAVNLTGSAWPVLKFWDRHRLVEGDWARLEVSPDGSNWYPLYGPTGIRSEWAEQSIDLSPWKNQSNLRIRFHVWTDGSATEDGWSVDDLQVVEHAPVALTLPFYERFEQGLTNWLHASWAVATNQPYEGSYAVRDTPGGRMAPDTQHSLVLGGVVGLTNVVNPQVTFWVRGQLWYRSYFRVHCSADGGLNWTELVGANINHDWSSDWTRVQVSLATWVGQTVRLRFYVSDNNYAPDTDIFVDKVTIQELPAAVTLQTLTPALRSVALTWTPATLGAAFASTKVYRATHADVGLGDTLVGTFTDPNVTNLTDTGLSIGTTYYYRIFTVDTNDVHSPSNERSTTTVPVLLPLADGFETTAQWATTGTWGVGAAGRNGSCLSDSPVGDYGNSTDTYALTAVNLVGSSWPVLKFWDRHRLVEGDWARLEVSPDGNNWYPLYGPTGIRSEWAEQSIDLSPWKNQSNLRIRFHVWTDGSTTEDGWSIDDLQVVEHTPVAVSLPFYERFEGGLTNWLHANWAVDPNRPYEGSYAVRDTPGGRMAPDTQHSLVLGGVVGLTNVVNPQVTFWVRGQLWYRSYFRVHCSADGGLNWTELVGANINHDWSSDWTRVQVSLATWVGQTVRLRFYVSDNNYAPDTDIFVDKVTIQELPTPVTLNPPDQITVSSARLTWTEATIPNFRNYRIYRSESGTPDESSTLVAIVTNQLTTTFTDPGLSARKTYYYRVYLADTNDTTTPSNQASTTTLGVDMPWADGFESRLPGWTFTGAWTNWPGAGRNGGSALVDSPGDYANSSDTAAQFAVDLRDRNWPVLKFWDRHALADGDWGRLEVSVNGGAGWSPIYSVAGTRLNWAEQSIDLSPWKGQAQVWIRFRLMTDGGTQNDGWAVDDLALAENSAPPIAYPFYENFEHGLSNWLHATWTVDTNLPFAGGFAVRDTQSGRMTPDTTLWLVLANELSLSNAIDPQLTFWLRGQLYYRSWFRVQASTDGGLNWTDLPAGQDYDWNSAWVKRQVSLLSYTNRSIRLRFQTSCNNYAPDTDVFLDNIGIGEPSPGGPSLHAPRDLGIVGVLRPTLVVNNAIDYQGDPLSYRFEVYADAALSNLVSQVPVVASGVNTTAWQVDVNLPDHSQFWWRCVATSGTNTGPWMTTASFYINHTNRAPFAVVIPPGVPTLTNTAGVLTWYPTTDPDPGDFVDSYQVQVDDDPNFGSPVIDQSDVQLDLPEELTPWLTVSLPLSEFAGAANLVSGRSYYWRVRAQDSYFALSDWPAGEHWFRYGMTLPESIQLTAINPPGANRVMSLGWSPTSSRVYVEFRPALETGSWQTIAGPLSGHSYSFTNQPALTNGFFRLRRE